MTTKKTVSKHLANLDAEELRKALYGLAQKVESSLKCEYCKGVGRTTSCGEVSCWTDYCDDPKHQKTSLCRPCGHSGYQGSEQLVSLCHRYLGTTYCKPKAASFEELRN